MILNGTSCRWIFAGKGDPCLYRSIVHIPRVAPRFKVQFYYFDKKNIEFSNVAIERTTSG